MSFAANLGLLAGTATSTAVLLSALLAMQIADRSFTELKEARLTVLLFSLRSTIQTSLDLGLQLDDLRQIQDLIEREKAAAEVRAIDVSDATGVSLFSTDRGAIGDRVPSGWSAAMVEQRGVPFWRAQQRGEVILGTPVESDFGQVVGQLAVIVAEHELTGGTSLPLARLSLPLVVAIGAGALAGGVATALMRRLVQPLAGAATAGATELGRGDPVLAASGRRALASLAGAGAALDAAAHELGRIDGEI